MAHRLRRLILEPAMNTYKRAARGAIQRAKVTTL